MTNKYYLKKKCNMCEYYKRYPEYPKRVDTCNGKGFTRGADVTELIEVIENDKRISGQEFGYILDITKDLIEVVEEE